MTRVGSFRLDEDEGAEAVELVDEVADDTVLPLPLGLPLELLPLELLLLAAPSFDKPRLLSRFGWSELSGWLLLLLPPCRRMGSNRSR
jgi:hypothetical protein